MGYLKRFFKGNGFEKKRLLAILFKRPFQKIGFGHYGRKTFIYKPKLIKGKKYIFLDDNVKFFDGARIEALDSWGETDPTHFCPSIHIGENTSFESDAHITSAGNITIGKNCTFSCRCLITSINHSYKTINERVLLQPLEVADVTIGENCFFGMDSKVFPGVHIGDNVIVGANTLVNKDIPSYCVVVGSPCRIIKKYDFKTKSWEKVA
jgi:acetyltransferase-like isoleucine patch superfamily enzyme